MIEEIHNDFRMGKKNTNKYDFSPEENLRDYEEFN